ncbi:MAG: tetratricopeptide repeat protein [Bacteroidota bacterium]
MNHNRMELISEMLEKNPDDTFLNYAAALEYKKENNINKAMSFFRRIIDNDPEYLPTYYQLGKLLEEKNKTEEAVVIYKQGRELAKKKNDIKTLGELSEALLILDEDDGEAW